MGLVAIVQSINCWFRRLILVLSGMGWLGAQLPLFACSVGLWGTLTVRSLRLCKLAERKGEARGCELLDWRGPTATSFLLICGTEIGFCCKSFCVVVLHFFLFRQASGEQVRCQLCGFSPAAPSPRGEIAGMFEVVCGVVLGPSGGCSYG